MTVAFRQRTSCVEDHLVIEVLRELGEDIWETLALLIHWTEDADTMWSWRLVALVKKKNGLLSMRGFHPIAVLPTIFRFYSEILKSLAGPALEWRRGPRYRHVWGRQAHEVIVILRRLVEQVTGWQIPIFVMDSDVAAAFDHVSHHVIVNVMDAMKVSLRGF